MKKVLPLFIKILLIHFFVFFYSHAKAEVTITALIAETGPVSNIAQTIIEAAMKSDSKLIQNVKIFDQFLNDKNKSISGYSPPPR